jgi:hypothetical protein
VRVNGKLDPCSLPGFGHDTMKGAPRHRTATQRSEDIRHGVALFSLPGASTARLVTLADRLQVRPLCPFRRLVKPDYCWDQIDLKAGTLLVPRLKRGSPSTHPLRGPEIRALRAWRQLRLHRVLGGVGGHPGQPPATYDRGWVFGPGAGFAENHSRRPSPY